MKSAPLMSAGLLAGLAANAVVFLIADGPVGNVGPIVIPIAWLVCLLGAIALSATVKSRPAAKGLLYGTLAAAMLQIAVVVYVSVRVGYP